MPGDLIRNLVAFQNVLQACDPDTETFHGSEKDKDFILSVGMAMNEPFSTDDFQNCLEFEIFFEGGFFKGGLLLEAIIFEGGVKTVFEESFDAHTRLRKASDVFVSPVGLFHVFSQGEFDPRGSSFHDEIHG